MTTPDTPGVPETVRRVVDRYLALADEALPGRIEGLYLVGSLALSDYHEGQSDIDFVALTEIPLSSGEMDRMEAVHQTLSTDIGRPWFDGIYVTWSDLAQSPEEVQSAGHSQEGRFQRSRGFEANPAIWLTLRNHPLPVRGGIPNVWYDPDVLRRWIQDNLNSYWADMASQLERAASRLTEEAISQAVPWCVSGVARLAYTLATGDVTSKSGACRYALTVYPEQWHPIVSAALVICAGAHRPQSISLALVEDTVAFMRWVIQVENARHAELS